jgi:PhnB protein
LFLSSLKQHDMFIPQGHQALMPYLILNNAAAFIEFAAAVLQAKPRLQVPRNEAGLIMHAELDIHGSTLMCADATAEWPARPAGMFVYVPDADAAYTEALRLGALSVMEPCDKDYGRTCGVTDPYGNTWWLTTVKG